MVVLHGLFHSPNQPVDSHPLRYAIEYWDKGECHEEQDAQTEDKRAIAIAVIVICQDGMI